MTDVMGLGEVGGSVVNKYAQDIRIQVSPTQTTQTANVEYLEGRAEASTTITETLTIQIPEKIPPFQGINITQRPVIGLWYAEAKHFMAIPKNLAGKIKCWSDLNNAPIFLGWARGFTTELIFTRMAKALGIRVNPIYVGTDDVPTLMKRGELIATYLDEPPSPWMKSLEASIDLAILNPCSDELAKLRSVGFKITSFEVGKPSFDRVSGTAIGWVTFYGILISPRVPEDVVYRILKVIDEHIDEVVAAYGGLRHLKEQGLAKWLYYAVDSVGDAAPIHPGLAKFLREKGLWRSEWDKLVARG